MNFDLTKYADSWGRQPECQTCRAEFRLNLGAEFRREYSGLQKEMDCKL